MRCPGTILSLGRMCFFCVCALIYLRHLHYVVVFFVDVFVFYDVFVFLHDVFVFMLVDDL